MSSNQDTRKQYFELRRYHLLTGKKKNRVGDFLRDSAIPALNRLGVGPVGASRFYTVPTSLLCTSCFRILRSSPWQLCRNVCWPTNS